MVNVCIDVAKKYNLLSIPQLCFTVDIEDMNMNKNKMIIQVQVSLRADSISIRRLENLTYFGIS